MIFFVPYVKLKKYMLELQNICYSIEEDGKKKNILSNFSYKFLDGTITAVTGENGSGKSTLTKIIMGILKPTEGKILYNGKDITNMCVSERACLGFNYAFQQPVSFKGLTVKDLIDIATGEENSVSKACEYLSKVGICAKEYINRDFNKTLSGGEQKRIELALALAKKGDVHIFDEPEAGIDLWSFEKLTSLFDAKKCNIIVSHQEKLLKHADNVIVLKGGKIACVGKSKDVLKKLDVSVCSLIKGGKDGIR